jgi:hypothetical protein
MNAPDFAGASREVLSFLHQRIGMDLWMVTRADNEDWVVLAAEDHSYGVKQGDVFRWADTFCSRMVRGDGPRVAPRAIDVPAYAALPITRQLPIGAYVGVPLVDTEGQLFGTLCGLNPQPMPASIVAEQPMVEVLADMLSGLLSAELSTSALTREAETARSEALTDALTGLANRRGWEVALAAEEERCRRYGATACVVAIELDGMKSPGVSPVARDAHETSLIRAGAAPDGAQARHAGPPRRRPLRRAGRRVQHGRGDGAAAPARAQRARRRAVGGAGHGDARPQQRAVRHLRARDRRDGGTPGRASARLNIAERRGRPSIIARCIS